MKIIGYNEYYDYLTGVYGVDPHVVLDRRGGKKLYPVKPVVEYGYFYDAIECAFCGVSYYGVVRWPGGRAKWGNDIKALGTVVKRYRYRKDSSEKMVMYKHHKTGKKHYFEYQETLTSINSELGVPILARIQNGDWQKYPIGLAQFGFTSVMPPDKAYRILYSWLLERKNEKFQDVLTDNEKINAKGFDDRASFRHRT